MFSANDLDKQPRASRTYPEKNTKVVRGYRLLMSDDTTCRGFVIR